MDLKSEASRVRGHVCSLADREAARVADLVRDQPYSQVIAERIRNTLGGLWLLREVALEMDEATFNHVADRTNEAESSRNQWVGNSRRTA